LPQQILPAFYHNFKAGERLTAGFRLKFNRLFKNKHQAVSQGARRFGKRSISGYVSIYKSRATPDHGVRRCFSKAC
jgi:hypothetical protein